MICKKSFQTSISTEFHQFNITLEDPKEYMESGLKGVTIGFNTMYSNIVLVFWLSLC